MIVDVHSHYFSYPGHFSDTFRDQARRARGDETEVDLTVRWPEYEATAAGCKKTIVFGGKAKLSGLWVPDDEVAAYVNAHPDRLLGFVSLDPTQPGWQDELEHGHRDLKMKGIKLMPMYAGFYPTAREFDPLWEYAIQYGLPVLFNTGTKYFRQAPHDSTETRLIDDMAIRFPE
ncbi:MAG: amidohydrolase family protein, partial [Bryobacteraceae bacterium]